MGSKLVTLPNLSITCFRENKKIKKSLKVFSLSSVPLLADDPFLPSKYSCCSCSSRKLQMFIKSSTSLPPRNSSVTSCFCILLGVFDILSFHLLYCTSINLRTLLRYRSKGVSSCASSAIV